ncbi:MAG: hypothetical protein V4634_10915 [Pseudomonadota bacterium]
MLWYHLDHSDSDLCSFFSYFGEALSRISTQASTCLPKFAPEQMLDFPLFCTHYLRQAFEHLPVPCAIVLDDYHQAASRMLDHFLKTAIMEAPAGVRLFITSRTPPPSFLAREHANRSLGIVDWDKLKFDAEEISALCDAAGVSGNGELIASLSQKTLGWAAGLILLLEKAKTGDTSNWGLSSGHSPEAIFNYFAEEIFELESQRSQQTLLALAFLPQYTTQMATDMAGDPLAGEIVDDLSRRNFFTDKRDGPVASYQFHALFREFLARKARGTYSIGELRQLQRASALLMEQNNAFDTAVSLYRELEDFTEVERIILAQAEGLWSLGHSETISRWIRYLPYERIEAGPMLLYWSAKTEFFSNPPHARQLMEQAYPGLAAAGAISEQVMAASEILRCYFNEWKSFREIEPWIERLENLLEKHGGQLSTPMQASAYCGLLLALMFRQPHRPVLKACADRLAALMSQELEPNLKISMATCLLGYSAWRGQLSHCEEALAHARPLLELPETTALSRMLFGTTKLHYLACIADYPAAKAEFGVLTQIAPNDKQFFLRALIYSRYAQVCLAAGRLDEADTLIAELGRIVDPRRSVDLMALHYVRSWRLLLRGDAVLARKEAACMLPLYADSAASRAYAQGLAAYAVASAMAGELDAVAAAVSEVRDVLKGLDSPWVELHLLLVEAYVQLRSGHRAACHQRLAAGLGIAKREGLLNTMQWVPGLIAPLCAEALEAGIEPEYVARLIRHRHLDPPVDCYMQDWPWPVEIRALGNFEIRIEGELLQFTHKAQKKPLEFLKFLIAQGGKNVNAEKLADALWPDSEGDAAQSSFDTTLHRLRKLLRHDDVITLSEGKLSINSSLCWLDIWALDKLAEAGASYPSAKESSGHARQLLQIYRGPFFFADADFQGQGLAMASHRSKFERCLMDLCGNFQSAGNKGRAIELLQQGLARDAEAKMLPVLLRDLKQQMQ